MYTSISSLNSHHNIETYFRNKYKTHVNAGENTQKIIQTFLKIILFNVTLDWVVFKR